MRGWRAAFVVAFAVQCWALYLPRAPSPPSGLPLDKVAHVALFAAVAALGVLAGFPVRLVVAICVAQALLSETIQGLFLPGRSGDARDLLADFAGIALGLLAGRRWLAAAP